MYFHLAALVRREKEEEKRKGKQQETKSERAASVPRSLVGPMKWTCLSDAAVRCWVDCNVGCSLAYFASIRSCFLRQSVAP